MVGRWWGVGRCGKVHLVIESSWLEREKRHREVKE